MGLGCLDAVPLAKARKFAAQCRDDLEAGRNPLKVRRAAREEQLALTDQRQASKTFGDVAEALIASKAPGRRNAKHRAQWVMTLSVYAAPLRALSVAQVTTDDILAVLEPIWILKSETASRTRGRIEAVLDAARVRGLAPALAANPARWRGHLELLLPEPRRLSRGHHAALPWRELPAFMADLRLRKGTAARALEWCILTASRLGGNAGRSLGRHRSCGCCVGVSRRADESR